MAFATRKVVKGAKGKPHVMFVDPATGEPIPHSEIGNYTLIEQGNNLDIPSHTKKAVEDDRGGFAGTETGGDADWGNRYQDEDPAPDIGERTHQNNFGYINKPALVSLLSHAPGLLGTFGKGINVAINVNNLSAVNAARSSIGLAPVTGKAAFKSAIQDNKGYVGDIVTGDTQYAVGLESLSPTGRTTLTPAEANSRLTKAGLAGKESREATPQEAKAAVKAHTAEFGPVKDFGSPRGIAKAVVDSLIETVSPSETAEGRSPEDTTPVAPDDHPENAGQNQTAPDPNEITNSIGNSRLNPTGKGRNVPVNPELTNAIIAAVQSVLGPDAGIAVASGTYTPEVQANIDAKLKDLQSRGISPGSKQGQKELESVGQVGSTRHNHGQAVDFDILDGNGRKVVDTDVIAEIALAMGERGIKSLAGDDPGYMGKGRLHADLHGDKASTWSNTPGKITQAFNKGKATHRENPVGQLPDNVPTPYGPESEQGLAGTPGTPGAPGSSGEPAPGSIADAFIESEVTGETNTGTPGQLSFVPVPDTPAPESNKEGTQPVPAPTPTQNPGQQASGQVGQGFVGGQGQGG